MEHRGDLAIRFHNGTTWDVDDIKHRVAHDARRSEPPREVGTDDRLNDSGWYSMGNSARIEQFETADSKLLQKNQVDALVQAMAAFAPPALGQTSLLPDYQATLAPVIAAGWQ